MSIAITIPMDPEKIKETGTMLLRFAAFLGNDGDFAPTQGGILQAALEGAKSVGAAYGMPAAPVPPINVAPFPLSGVVDREAGTWTPQTGLPVPPAAADPLSGLPVPPGVGAATVPFVGDVSGAPTTTGLQQPSALPVVTALPGAPQAPSGPAVDSEGLPWDARIHASTKTRRKNDDTWKLIKGLDAAVVEKVKAELRATMGLSVPAPAAPAAPVAPAAPAAPVAPAAPLTTMTYVQLAQYVTGEVQGNRLTMDQVNGYLSSTYGLVGFAALEHRADLIPHVHQFLKGISVPFTAASPSADVGSLWPDAVTPPAAPADPAPATYADMCAWMVDMVGNAKFTRENVQTTFTANGLPSVPALEHRPDMIPVIYNALNALVVA